MGFASLLSSLKFHIDHQLEQAIAGSGESWGAAAGDEAGTGEADLRRRPMRSFDWVEHAGELAGAHRITDLDGGLEDAGKRGVGEGAGGFPPA